MVAGVLDGLGVTDKLALGTKRGTTGALAAVLLRSVCLVDVLNACIFAYGKKETERRSDRKARNLTTDCSTSSETRV